MKQSEPLKTGFLVEERDQQPSDLPVKLIFPNGSLRRLQSNELYVDFSGGLIGKYVLVAGDTMAGTLSFPVGGFTMADSMGNNWAITITPQGALVSSLLIVSTSFLLLESGEFLLLEDGAKLLLET